MIKIIKRTIWTDEVLLSDWEDDLREQYPDASEDELYDLMTEINSDDLDCERANLNIKLGSPIICIADIGRWNGRVGGYKVIKSGNISDCLYSDCDYNTWYVDELGDLRCDATHHDGTNFYLYRVLKDNLSDVQIENFEGKILDGTVTRADINRYTKKLGDYIADVYGW